MATNEPEFSLPRDDEHMAVWGRTGTGKTQLSTWVLAQQLRNYPRKPFVVVDYKHDDLIGSLENTRELDFKERIPKKAGLYILQPRPDQSEEMETWLWKLWQKENVGLYVDEGYMLPPNPRGAFFSLQTQGRSKRIPIITVSQRPTLINRSVVSEASHVALFSLNDEQDIKRAEEIVPRKFATWLPPQFEGTNRLPDYHARWYSVKTDDRFVLRPVPDADTIRRMIDSRLEPKVRWL